MAETRTQQQVRLVLQKQAADLSRLIAEKVPAGVGFCLVLADAGERGNMAYLSNAERPGMMKMLGDLLAKQRLEEPRAPRIVSSDDCACCHSCLSPGDDTDRALVTSFVSGLLARSTTEVIAGLLCPRHSLMAADAARFVLDLTTPTPAKETIQ